MSVYSGQSVGESRPVNGQHYIQLVESDFDDTYLHGIAVAPAHMSLADAKRAISDALASVRAADNRWNYDDLYGALHDLGFETIHPGTWVEDVEDED